MEYNLLAEMFQNKNGTETFVNMQNKISNINSNVNKRNNFTEDIQKSKDPRRINIIPDKEMATRAKQNNNEKQDMGKFKPSNETFGVFRQGKFGSPVEYNYSDREYNAVRKNNELNFIKRVEYETRIIRQTEHQVRLPASKKDSVNHLLENSKPRCNHKHHCNSVNIYFPDKD